MKKYIRTTAIFLFTIFVAIQFIRPERKTPVIQPENDMCYLLHPSTEIARLLKNACYDCHSYHTQYPWYAEVAPFSWLIAEHVRHGRGELNFSDWKSYPQLDQSELLLHSGRLVRKGHMPMPGYVRFHPEAQLTEKEKDHLIHWFRNTGEAIQPE